MVSFSWPDRPKGTADGAASEIAEPELSPAEAEEILRGLAGVFSHHHSPARARHVVYPPERLDQGWSAEGLDETQLPNLEARYRALVEQIPAVVFMAYLDRGIGEAYVSPQIEAALGFSQEEWLEDPVRWYSHIHPDDKQRWSAEAAEMFLTGNPLRSAYRVISRDGRVIWFHCEAKMIRKENGEPWFIHGVGFDITDLKRTEEALGKRAQRRFGDSRYGGGAGRGVGRGRQDHPLQSRLRTDHGILFRGSSGKIDLGFVSGSRRGGRLQDILSIRRGRTRVRRSMKVVG